MYFNYELSSVIVPLGIFLYLINKNFRSYILYSLVVVSIFGTIDTYLKKDLILHYKHKYGAIQYYGSLFFHLILLLCLLEFKKYGFPNLGSYTLLFFNIIIAYLLPYWPYVLSRQFFIKFVICVGIVLSLIYNILY